VARRVGNDVLLALVLVLVLSGVLGWALPISSAGWLYDVHRVFGVAIVAAVVFWKWDIATASLRKRVQLRRGRAAGRGRRRFDGSVLWGVLPGVALLLALAIGLAWTLGLIGPDLLWGYSPLNIHVFVGIGLVPFVAVHMLRRRRQNAISAPALSRRTLLTTGAAGVAALVGWQAIERLTPAVRLPTGSKAIGSFNANAFPAEIWQFDSVPLLDPATWRVSVLGRELTLEALTRAHAQTTVRVVLDCTSGWWSEQDWTGVALRDVLAGASTGSGTETQAVGAPARGQVPVTSVAVTSVTGHRIVLDPPDIDRAILATHVGGETISPGHGFPLRLVVPDRRGYYWVKWVAAIDAA
jgi:DMSO/TMAO reductase YedYZ molybdopterin-dependent catalytic subunit